MAQNHPAAQAWTTVGDRVVVPVDGELDVATGPALRERLLELVDAGARDVVVDLTRVSFLDSSGLGVLITALKRLRADGGTLRLAGCRPSVLQLLEITALGRVFFVYPSVDEALADPLRYVPPVTSAPVS